MSRQDKATSERHAKILRELVKRPENKVCADCKRNDPRWASWNLGVFLCIRCSGIHRGMGTHISRVKSIDLDMWTPEQMDSIQKWGNRRANLYWEAHLKAGHIPPEHKMESYIRSKYETRRWALDGPAPSDPSILEGGSTSISTGDGNMGAPSPSVDHAVSDRATHTPSNSLSVPRATSPSLTLGASPFIRHQQPQPHRLLSAAVAGRTTSSTQPLPSAATAPPVQAQTQSPQPTAQDDFFALDFHAPSAPKSSSSPPPPIKDVKQDILSLFSAPARASTTVAQPSNAYGQFASAQPSWDAIGSGVQQQQQPTSMMGASGVGMWGTSSGWTAPVSNNIWSTPSSAPTTTNNNLGALNTNDIWSSGSNNNASTTTNGLFASSQTSAAPKKDNVFGDLWGDFK